MKRSSILVVGAAGRLGQACLYSLSKDPTCPEVHAFCNDVSTLSDVGSSLCTSVIEGSARHAIDIEDALRSTNASWIILCVGTGDDSGPSNIRTFAGQSVSRVLQKHEFLKVRVVTVSMSSPTNHCFNRFRLRYVISDHKGQEDALAVLGKRALIVRCTQFSTTATVEDAVDNANSSAFDLSLRSVSSSSSSSSSSSETMKQPSPPGSPISVTKRISWFRKGDTPGTKSSGRTSARMNEIADGGNEPALALSTPSRIDVADWISNHVCARHSLSDVERSWATYGGTDPRLSSAIIGHGNSVRIYNFINVPGEDLSKIKTSIDFSRSM